MGCLKGGGEKEAALARARKIIVVIIIIISAPQTAPRAKNNTTSQTKKTTNLGLVDADHEEEARVAPVHDAVRAVLEEAALAVGAREALAHDLALERAPLVGAARLAREVLGEPRLALLVDQQQELDRHDRLCVFCCVGAAFLLSAYALKASAAAAAPVCRALESEPHDARARRC